VTDVKGLPSWLRAANRAAIAMSRIGLTMGPVCVLTVPGRRTGKPRSAPVSPLTVGGGRYLVSALPDSEWARNVRAGITASPDPDPFAAAASHVAVFQIRPAPPARRNEEAP
jgi:hypothetical protein